MISLFTRRSLKSFISIMLSLCMLFGMISCNSIIVQAESSEPKELVIDNEDNEGRFEVFKAGNGTWNTSTTAGTTFPTRVGNNHHYANGNGDYALWKPIASDLETGRYEVFINALTHTSNDSQASVQIVTSNAEPTTIQLNLKTVTAGYVSVGVYNFTGDGNEYVKMICNTQGSNIRADSVKFVEILPLPSAKPIASDVLVKGNPYINSQLVATYKYSDENIDGELDSEYEWQISDDGIDSWAIISSGTTDASQPNNLIIKEDYIGKYIRFTITPKNDNNEDDNGTGETVKSDLIGPIQSIYIIDTLNSLNYYENSDRFGSSSTGGVSINGFHRYVQEANDYAEFKKSDIEIGTYNVYYFYPLKNVNNNQTPLFKISSVDEVEKEVPINTSSNNTGDWILLGEYNFAPGYPISIKIVNSIGAESGGVTIRANAIKLEKVSDFNIAPSAENAELTGSMAVGAIITGKYEYVDLNGDTENESTFNLYRGITPTTENWDLITSGIANSNTDIDYTLVTEDAGKYIKLEIIPKSVNEPYEGKSVNLILGPIADDYYAPTIENLVISGKAWLDSMIIGTYDYIDKNGDLENDSTYQWQYADSANSLDWTNIINGSGKTTASGNISIRIPNSYLNKYIRLKIIPKNKANQKPDGEVFYSNIIGPIVEKGILPVLSDVKMGGQIVLAEGLEGAAIGGVANVSYKYFHELGYAEDTSVTKYTWYISDSVDGKYEPINGETTNTLLISEAMSQKFIKVGVKAQDIKGQSTEQMFSSAIRVKWKLTFNDEFDYVAADGKASSFTEKWISDNSQRTLGSPEVKSARIPENVEVKDGNLYIYNRKEHNNNYSFAHTWTTGNVKTIRNDFNYGYYESSYQLAPASGLNQSFWSMSDGVMAANKFIELDFNEGHYPKEVATNLHYTTDGTSRKTNSIKYYPYSGSEINLGNRFTKIAGILSPNNNQFEWNSSENSETYKVFINDDLSRSTYSLPYEPDGSRIYLSVAIYPGFAGALIDEQADGTEMVVDYVRYYEPIEITDYAISFESNGGTNVENIVQKKGMQISSAPITTKTDYIFEGWYSDSELINKVSFPFTISSDAILYAKWTYNKTKQIEPPVNPTNDSQSVIPTDPIVIIPNNAVSTLPKTIIVDKDIEEQLKKGEIPTITLSNKADSATIYGKTLKLVSKSKNDLVILSDNIAMNLSPNIIESLNVSSSDKFEFTLKLTSMKNIDIIKSNISINSELIKKSFEIDIKKNGNTVSVLDQPIKFTIDLTGFKLTTEQKNKLTGISFSDSGKFKQLGGVLNGNKFTFVAQALGNYSVIVSDNLVKMSFVIGETSYSINDVEKTTEVAPIIIENKTMVPLRFIAEAFGAEVIWEQSSETIKVKFEDRLLVLKIGEKKSGMDVAPIIVTGRTLVSIRYVSEQLGSNVVWNEATRSIDIYK